MDDLKSEQIKKNIKAQLTEREIDLLHGSKSMVCVTGYNSKYKDTSDSFFMRLDHRAAYENRNCTPVYIRIKRIYKELQEIYSMFNGYEDCKIQQTFLNNPPSPFINVWHSFWGDKIWLENKGKVIIETKFDYNHNSIKLNFPEFSDIYIYSI